MATVTAILGWGSLIWDYRPDFDRYRNEWDLDGPALPIEFMRVSKSRANALTLVLNLAHGHLCRVAYTTSKRSDPADAISDLRLREGTTLRNIGYFYADGSRQQSRNDRILSAISAWAKSRMIDAVAWTDLDSNFEEQAHTPFSVAAASTYLETLNEAGKAAAYEYISKAPAFVNTPIRRAAQSSAWFLERNRVLSDTTQNNKV